MLDKIHPLEVTGLLYEAKKENTLFGIFTGIQGGTLPRFSLVQPLAHNDGTDEMYIRYFGITDVPKDEKRNRIYINGKLCNPENFITNIQIGYYNTMQLLINNKKLILNFIKDYIAKKKVVVRYIFKATASYFRYINLITHTTALKNCDVLFHIRKELTALTYVQEPFKIFIIGNEIMDINNLTIPYIYKVSSDRNIYHYSGLHKKDFFIMDLFDEYSQGIEKLSMKEVKDDLIFIEKSLKSTSGIVSWEAFKDKFDYPEFNFEAQKKQLKDESIV